MRTRAPLDPWRLRAEAPLALLVGAAVGLAAFGWFAGFYLNAAVTADDLLDYCAAVASLVEDRPGLFPDKRARLPALLPWALAPRLGVFDALLAGAVAGTARGGAGLYLWGSALGSRLSGAAAALSTLTMAPLVMQARMPSFYATINGTLALAAGLTAAAVRTGRPVHYLAAGGTIGVALLADVRALVWALAFAGTLAVAAVVVRGGSRWLRLLALGAPLAVSFAVGPASFPEQARSLEEQLDVRPLFYLHGSRVPLVQPPYTYDSAYVWGRTAPWGIPATLTTLAGQARIAPPDDLRMHVPASFERHQVRPWLIAAGLTLPLALVGAARRRRRLGAALVGTGAPYLVALWGQQHMVEPQARFLTQSLPVVAVGLGLAFGWGLSQVPAPGRWGPALRAAAGALAVVAVVTGGLPTPLSPVAGWRLKWAPDAQQLADLDLALRRSERAEAMEAGPRACVEAIRRDHAAGHPRYSRWLDVQPP